MRPGARAALAGALALLAGCAGPEATLQDGHVAGVVRDAATGEPLAGAAVYAELARLEEPLNNTAAYEAGRTATLARTDAQGRFAMALPAGPHKLAVRAPGYLPARCEAEAPADGVRCALWPHPGLPVNGHRGASRAAPENTLASLRKAALMGADRLEFDVQLTLDEVPVLLHDDTLDRTTDGSGPVWHRTLAEVKRLDAGSWFDASFAGEPVPSLAEALALVKEFGVGAVIESKQPGPPWSDPRHKLVQRMAEEVRAAGLEEQVVLISFEPGYTAQCAQEGLRCGHIEEEAVGPTGAGPVLAQGFDEYHMSERVATPQHVAEAKTQGLFVTVWTVNEPARALELAELGVDSFTTDVPDEILAALEGARRPQGSSGAGGSHPGERQAAIPS